MSRLADFLRFDRRDARLWLGAAALLTIAFAAKLAPGWLSSDDWALVTGAHNERGHRLQFLSQGRFGMALLQTALLRLGADPVHSPTFFSWVSIALFACAAVMIARAWDLRDDLLLALLACALPFAHPTFADTWSFRIAPFYESFAMVLAFTALALLRRGTNFLFLPVLLVALALSVYQITLNPLFVAALMGFLIDLVRVRDFAEGRAAAVRVWLITLGALVAGVALYLVCNKLVLSAAHLEPELRNGLVDLSALRERLAEIAQLYPQLLWRGRALSAPWLVLLQGLLLGLVVLLLLVRMRGSSLPLSLLLIVFALASVVGVVGLVKVLFISPRSMCGLGLLWGGLLATLTQLGEGRLRALAVGLAALLAIGWLAIDSRAADEQLLRNTRDLAIANRLVGRLETLPGWEHVRRIALVDARLTDGDLRTVEGNLNNSALGEPWSTGALLQETSGRILEPAGGDEILRARARCNGAHWPDAASAFIEGELAAVCF